MNRGANERRTERRRAHGAEEVSTAGRLSPCKHAAVSPAPKRTHDDLPRKVLSGRDSRSPLFTSPWNTTAPERLRICPCSVRSRAARRWRRGAGTGTRSWPGWLRCAALR